jgi:hypothetical protein
MRKWKNGFLSINSKLILIYIKRNLLCLLEIFLCQQSENI